MQLRHALAIAALMVLAGCAQHLQRVPAQGVWLVSMSQRVDDNTWIASLDRHRHGPGGPFRRCSSYEQGRAGAEIWVARHEARLRQDVAEISRWRKP